MLHGCLQDWAVPQAWFLHFYVVGSCCNAAVLLAYCLSSAPSTSGTHVVRRRSAVVLRIVCTHQQRI